MNAKLFQSLQPHIVENLQLREPQKEGFHEIEQHYKLRPEEREVGLVLPVGCGKSGLITIAPFATRASRALVIAPGVRIAKQLYDDFSHSNSSMFYKKCEVLQGPPYPELAEMRGTQANRDDLDHADVVVTNIQQIQGRDNQWLISLPDNYFDLILFDEAHHNVAESWDVLRTKFPNARIVNFSATPTRADGALMSGRIIYSFPIFRAMGKGYVKRVKALVLNPRSLRYVQKENGQVHTVNLAEVRRLAESDANFRRGIVSSEETLTTIVDASIRELEKLREKTGEKRLKIIASALNQEHCSQIVGAYRARGMRADFVHTKLDGAANKRVFTKLDNHELDVIVQVRMLGEGFDHPFLSVAAVFSVFGNLSPFAQFVGRIMRVIKQRAPRDPINTGTVVFHAGSNTAKVWADFQEFSEADREFFEQLLPTEQWHYGEEAEHEVEISIPGEAQAEKGIEVHGQDGVSLEEIPLLQRDPHAREMLRSLIEEGLTLKEFEEELQRIPTSRYEEKKAARMALEEQTRIAAGRLLNERKMPHDGKKLDKKHLGKSNFMIVKSYIDEEINRRLGRGTNERHLATLEQFKDISRSLPDILSKVSSEVFDAEG